MSKQFLDVQEWYPVWAVVVPETSQDETLFDAVEIPAEKLEWVKKVFDEFRQVQKYLQKLEKLSGE